MKKVTVRFILDDILLATLFFSAAFFVRVCDVGALSINQDEAHWARYLLAHSQLLKKLLLIPITAFPNYIWNFSNRMIPVPQAITLADFMYHVRFIPVLLGACTVLVIYVLAKQMYGRRTAIISSLLLCFLPWHIIVSRISCRVIRIPLFGCLIFLCLFKAGQSENRIRQLFWFLLSCLFLKQALGSHESAALFILIFFVCLLCISNTIKRRAKPKELLIAVVMWLLLISPFLFQVAATRFYSIYSRAYHNNIFAGNLFFNIIINIKANLFVALKELFLNFRTSSFLYGEALRSPLLIHPIVFFIILASVIYSIIEWKLADKIILIWFSLGLLGGLAGVNYFQARHIFIILPPAIILIAKFISRIFEHLPKEKSFRRALLLIMGAVICIGLISSELGQWLHFYYNSPLDFSQCVQNSYGCKESSQYLIENSAITNCNIFTDARMPVDVYINYYLLNSGKGYFDVYRYLWDHKITKERRCSYYLFWAKETHLEDYGDGSFKHLYNYFKKKFPAEMPVKTIYYHNGMPAIFMYKVEEDDHPI